MPGQPQARGPRPPHSHNGHNGHSGHNGHNGPKPKPAHKRDHSSAFNKPTAPRTPAAPAVPSFGNPLPSKPPPAADANGNNRKQKKRKRKHNQLGLTPKTEDHESSEDDEEADEESKLAPGGSDPAPLQFSYRGQTSTLQTPSDIAAWIAERRKKFPTKERVEEKQKAADEAKATREAARQQKLNEQQAKRNADRKPSDNTESPTKADNQRRADKIQRNLDREQKRIAKAIAEAEAARVRFEALQKEALRLSSGAQSGPVDVKAEPHDLPPKEPPISNEPPIPESPSGAHATVDAEVSDSIDKIENPLNGEGDGDGDGDGEDMDISGSDWTSSSGSEAGSDSDSNSDSAPEQVSSRRAGPERVAPPPREGRKTACRYFARTGQCNRGDQCKFLHETPERGPKPKAEKKEKGRKGLYQAVSIYFFFFYVLVLMALILTWN